MKDFLAETFPLLMDVPMLLIAGSVIYFSTSLRKWFLSVAIGASILVVVRIHLAGRGTDWIVGQLAALVVLSFSSGQCCLQGDPGTIRRPS